MKTSSQIKAVSRIKLGVWSTYTNKGCGKNEGGQTPGGWNILYIPTKHNEKFYHFIFTSSTVVVPHIFEKVLLSDSSRTQCVGENELMSQPNWYIAS